MVVYQPTRAVAREVGETLYLTGKLCPAGHQSPRYVSNGACSSCLGVRVAAGLRGELPPRKCRKCGTEISKLRCQQCWKKVSANFRRRNRKALAERQKQSVAQCRRFLRDYKSQNPCTDCKQKFPWYVMEFDHLLGRSQPGDVTLSRVVNTGSIDRVKREMAKCHLVCANCHKVRTNQRDVAAGRRK